MRAKFRRHPHDKQIRWASKSCCTIKTMTPALKRKLLRDISLLSLIVSLTLVACFALVHFNTSHPQLASAAYNVDPAAHGQQLFNQSCATCHGLLAQGMPHRAPDLHASRFILSHNDSKL